MTQKAIEEFLYHLPHDHPKAVKVTLKNSGSILFGYFTGVKDSVVHLVGITTTPRRISTGPLMDFTNSVIENSEIAAITLLD